MRYIRKGDSPEAFERWKEQEQASSWEALPSRPSKHPEEGIHYYSRVELAAELIHEQQGLCAYCNEPIVRDHTTSIDHVEPRLGDTETTRVFDYGNLVASCDGNTKGDEKPAQRHCDNHKSNDPLLISPLQADCQNHIQFTDTGRVREPAGRDDVAETVRVLNLNVAKLVNARAEAIAGEIFTDIELTELIDADSARVRLDQLLGQEFTEVRLPAYFGALVSVLGRLAADGR